MEINNLIEVQAIYIAKYDDCWEKDIPRKYGLDQQFGC